MLSRVLVANRGEIAVRIMRAAAELGIPMAGIFSKDDTNALHRFKADEAYKLEGNGASAYLDADQIINIAITNGYNTIHPGYGFLSEQAAFAEKCSEKGITFIGPDSETLKMLGNKASARKIASECNVPILEGTNIGE